MRFEGKLALVTGATRGIGWAVAQALAAEGAHVLMLGRTQGALEELYDLIKKSNGEATGVPLDLTDGDALDRLGASIAERWGKLDMMVGNAGVLGPLTPVSHIDPDDLAKVLAINVTANARLIRAMEPLLMQADAPRAVFTTSGAAQKCRPFWGAYASGKAALDALVRSWAHEHENDALRVNLVSPGPIRTAMRAQAMPGEDPDTLPGPADVAPLFLELLSTSETRTGQIVDFKR
ncbi:MAG: SDR family NAD(P)-dependent oxidoreductase [Alphaproteobacteria bacterium]|nr:SDR family NAD(P)-dependent oxidoreductase [Alphaproteobacteria bacterium]